MVAHFQKPVWLVMACAAFVAQVVPQAWAGDCDRGCCAAEFRDCCAVTQPPTVTAIQADPSEVPAGCPLCEALLDGSLAPAAESPCHCQLDARQEQPLSVGGGSSPQRDDLSAWVALNASSQEAPHGPGVSRTSVAASLSIPVRPVRILYGVWRK